MEEVIKMLPRYRVPIIKKKRNKRKTHEEYVEELKLKNPNIIPIEEYIGANTSILHRCLIDSYEWKARPSNLLNGACGCPRCSKRFRRTHDDYIKDVFLINSDIEVLEEYIDMNTPILHKCKKHNIQWKISPGNILYQKCGCVECGKEKIGDKNSKTHEEYVKELKAVNLNVVVLGTYIDANTAILHKCLIDEYEWIAQPSNLLFGKGCPKCAGNLKKSHDEYILELSKINSNIEAVEKYVNAHTPILHRCKIDNYFWRVSPGSTLHGTGCPRCNESKGERSVQQWLESHNIIYESQKTFVDCRDKKVLPFDFYLPNNNIAIEYDGEQHFRPVEHFGGEESFERTVKHDKIKNEYCKNNGIYLLRIPYFKDVEEELNNFLFI